jgi:flagellum-specific peptidoglycan hydrolase FlgJ
MTQVQHFLQETLTELNRLHRAYLLADPAGAPPEAQSAYQQFWANAERLRIAQELYESGAATDPETARRLWLICQSAKEYGQT